jgi:lipopolysaccharide export LptBFGC system permease protein LptF
MQMSTNFAVGGAMPALLGVWLPNIVYLFIGLVMYRRTQK